MTTLHPSTHPEVVAAAEAIAAGSLAVFGLAFLVAPTPEGLLLSPVVLGSGVPPLLVHPSAPGLLKGARRRAVSVTPTTPRPVDPDDLQERDHDVASWDLAEGAAYATIRWIATALWEERR